MKNYKLTRKGRNFISGMVVVLLVVVGCFSYRVSMAGFQGSTQNVALAATTRLVVSTEAPVLVPNQAKSVIGTVTPKPAQEIQRQNAVKQKNGSQQNEIKNEDTSTQNSSKSEYNLMEFIHYLPATKPVASETGKIANNNVEIFYAPHPDDELLSMGAAIAESIKNGNEVHVVLLSHGYETKAIKALNGDVKCQWHRRTHNPVGEGYQQLTEKEIGALRQVEFLNCVETLGVIRSNVHILNFDADRVTSGEIKLIMLGMEKQFAGALHCTSSYQDTHPFHKKAGEALLQLYKAGEVNSARFFISPVQWRQVEGVVISDHSIDGNVKAAANMYMQWNPDKKKFGIGFHSYQKPFHTLLLESSSKYHNPQQ